MINVHFSILKIILRLVTDTAPLTINCLWFGPCSYKIIFQDVFPELPVTEEQKADRNHVISHHAVPHKPSLGFEAHLEKVAPILELVASSFLCST